MVKCYLGIGSNLGNRRRNIRLALARVNSLETTKVVKVSRLMETEPIGGPGGQGKFLNAAAEIATSLGPVLLLRKLKEIEKGLGRKKAIRYGPRQIDLDIIFYGDRVINTPALKVPHPKAFDRGFVIEPLLEIL
ncbi:MAG: 2-amino-4-hydroxy-6-hydroxymethyldihydropteridine diphosphokinase [Candidatus Omnitrophota bacterium]